MNGEAQSTDYREILNHWSNSILTITIEHTIFEFDQAQNPTKPNQKY